MILESTKFDVSSTPNSDPQLMVGSARATVDRRGDCLLRIPEVRRRTGLSVATVYRRVDAKTFPPKVRLGPKSVAWYQSDIDAFVADPTGYRAA